MTPVAAGQARMTSVETSGILIAATPKTDSVTKGG